MRPYRLLATGMLALCLLSAADYDVIVRNARIVDGTGSPALISDVGIAGGKIAAIGRLANAKAARTIDARQHVLAPGFIDVHTHVETNIGYGAPGPLEKVPGADNFVRDGVTTLVTGNCGHSETPLSGFFGRIEKMRPGVNVASLIGHNDVRRSVMGLANRQATAEEIARMRKLVATAMEEGAVGFSTGLIYVPGTYANTEEVIALAKEAARFHGVYVSHMRDEGEHVTEAIEEAVRVGREAGMPVQLSHFKIDNKRLWGSAEKTIALVERYRKEGMDVTVDLYPYDRSSTVLSHLVPSWVLADGEQAIRERLATPATRARIAAEMRRMNESLGQQNYSYAMVGYCRAEPAINGKTISEINTLRSGAPGIDGEIKTILDMLAREPSGTNMIYHKMGMADVDRILKYPQAAIASDGWVIEHDVGSPHPRSYGTNARVLAEFVRKRRVVTLEEAIRKMTQLPAEKFGFRDRGRIREGYAADLVMFDPETIQDQATFAKPHQYSTGFDLVMVNGEIEVERDKSTGVRAGRVLRRQ